MSIVTARTVAIDREDHGCLVTLHLAGDPQLAFLTGEQLAELVPLVSALADGQTDLAELVEVTRQLPTVRRLLEVLS